MGVSGPPCSTPHPKLIWVALWRWRLERLYPGLMSAPDDAPRVHAATRVEWRAWLYFAAREKGCGWARPNKFRVKSRRRFRGRRSGIVEWIAQDKRSSSRAIRLVETARPAVMGQQTAQWVPKRSAADVSGKKSRVHRALRAGDRFVPRRALDSIHIPLRRV